MPGRCGPTPTAPCSQSRSRWNRQAPVTTIAWRIAHVGLIQPLGPKGEHHADQSMAALVMHINREVIAHGAEICLLRDLYRAQRDGLDPMVAAARRGDADEVSRLLDGGEAVPVSLLAETAGLRRWDVVRALVEHGAAVDVGNPSALHYAAAAGERAIVELLLDHGADRELADAQFGMTPAVWADHFGHGDVSAHLRGRPLR